MEPEKPRSDQNSCKKSGRIMYEPRLRSIYIDEGSNMTVQASQNESALVCAAQRRDKEALQLLLTRNWAWLKGLVFSIVGDPGEVDDVLQDICVRVITKIDTLREPERFRPWLVTLARRQALRYRQQKARTARRGTGPAPA